MREIPNVGCPLGNISAKGEQGYSRRHTRIAPAPCAWGLFHSFLFFCCSFWNHRNSPKYSFAGSTGTKNTLVLYFSLFLLVFPFFPAPCAWGLFNSFLLLFFLKPQKSPKIQFCRFHRDKNTLVLYFSQPHDPIKKKSNQKINFSVFWPDFGILDVSSWQYIQFSMRNPIFRSKISKSGVQGAKIRKNNLRKINCLIRFLVFTVFFWFVHRVIFPCVSFFPRSLCLGSQTHRRKGLMVT